MRLPDRLWSDDDGGQRVQPLVAPGFWLKLLDALVDAGAATKSTAIDSTYVKAQRAAFGAKRGRSAEAIGRSPGGWTTIGPRAH